MILLGRNFAFSLSNDLNSAEESAFVKCNNRTDWYNLLYQPTTPLSNCQIVKPFNLIIAKKYTSCTINRCLFILHAQHIQKHASTHKWQDRNKFRYCCKCKDHIDSSQFQNSELEKSKSCMCNKHTDTPEPPDTLHFCRKCNNHIPVSQFHAGQKQFMCKKHCAIRSAAKCLQNQTDISGKVNSERAWKICYRDSQKFPNTKMNLTKKKILQMLLEVDPLLQVCENYYDSSHSFSQSAEIETASWYDQRTSLWRSPKTTWLLKYSSNSTSISIGEWY